MDKALKMYFEGRGNSADRCKVQLLIYNVQEKIKALIFFVSLYCERFLMVLMQLMEKNYLSFAGARELGNKRQDGHVEMENAY